MEQVGYKVGYVQIFGFVLLFCQVFVVDDGVVYVYCVLYVLVFVVWENGVIQVWFDLDSRWGIISSWISWCWGWF